MGIRMFRSLVRPDRNGEVLAFPNISLELMQLNLRLPSNSTPTKALSPIRYASNMQALESTHTNTQALKGTHMYTNIQVLE